MTNPNPRITVSGNVKYYTINSIDTRYICVCRQREKRFYFRTKNNVATSEFINPMSELSHLVFTEYV